LIFAGSNRNRTAQEEQTSRDSLNRLHIEEHLDALCSRENESLSTLELLCCHGKKVLDPKHDHVEWHLICQ